MRAPGFNAHVSLIVPERVSATAIGWKSEADDSRSAGVQPQSACEKICRIAYAACIWNHPLDQCNKSYEICRSGCR